MTVLQIIIARTQKCQAGLSVAQWFAERAREHAGFEVQLIDVTEVDLWDTTVDCADAFVFVIPEDRDEINAALKNVIDSTDIDWEYKALGFIGYGNTPGVLGEVQTTKQVLATLKMMPIDESVAIDDVGRRIGAGRFVATDAMERSAKAVLDELWCLNPFLGALRGWAATTTRIGWQGQRS
jgi:NAD(P)H-dependent FMN reductase